MRRMPMFAVAVLALAASTPMFAQTNAPADSQFVEVNAPLMAFTQINLIDGTGGEPRSNMTVVVRDGRIVEVGNAASVRIPSEARVISGQGRTLLPGFVMMHEHLFYPTIAAPKFGLYPHTFAQLSLAGGATTIRTAGALDPQADYAVQRDIQAGRTMGADIDVTGPFLNGDTRIVDRMPVIHTPEDARQLVDYWTRQGATAFKLYQRITRDEMEAAIKAAHGHGTKVAAHLCSVTADEASALGVDSLEHGFSSFTDFVPGKKKDECPPFADTQRGLGELDAEGPQVGGLIDKLIARNTAITSTLTVMALAYLPAKYPAPAGALKLLSPELQAFNRRWVKQGGRGGDPALFDANFTKVAKLHRRFFHKGGLLMAGSDPSTTGVIPGFSAQSEYQFMIGFGYKPAEAIQIMTLNGAKYLGKEAEIGSVRVGRRADLVLVDGDLARDRTAIDRIQTVFKAGVGYNRAKVLAAYEGKIGYTDSYAYSPDEH